MYKEISQKILDVLKADSTINKKVKHYYFGSHDIRKPNTEYPFIDVKWTGGPVKKLKTGTTTTRREIQFLVRCVHRHVDEEIAEKFVMDLSEQMETVLDANDQLNNLVEGSRVVDVVSDEMSIGGWSVVGAALRLRCKT